MKTAGQIAYAAWHGYEPGPEDWPEGDKIVAKWEAVGKAVMEAERKACIRGATPEGGASPVTKG